MAICLHIFKNRYVAEVLYQDFKRLFVSHWQPQKQNFERTIDIADFLIDHHSDLIKAADYEEQEEEIIGWGLVEEAERLLEADVFEVEPNRLFRPVAQPQKPLFQVGDVVQTTAAFLDSPVSSRAVVYEHHEGGGISIITEAGDDLGGFSVEDQQQYLLLLYHADGFTYELRSVSYLYQDWRRGVFLGVFR